MNKPRLTNVEINKIISLRKKGNTLSEIRKLVPKSKGTIYRYIKDVIPYKKFQATLAGKIHGTKRKAEQEWNDAEDLVKNKIGQLKERDLMLIAGILYWGEGNKKYELNLINSDYHLTTVFLKGLLALGVKKSDIRISLRLFRGMDEKEAISFWLKQLDLDKSQMRSIEWVEGKRKVNFRMGCVVCESRKAHCISNNL